MAPQFLLEIEPFRCKDLLLNEVRQLGTQEREDLGAYLLCLVGRASQGLVHLAHAVAQVRLRQLQKKQDYTEDDPSQLLIEKLHEILAKATSYVVEARKAIGAKYREEEPFYPAARSDLRLKLFSLQHPVLGLVIEVVHSEFERFWDQRVRVTSFLYNSPPSFSKIVRDDTKQRDSQSEDQVVLIDFSDLLGSSF